MKKLFFRVSFVYGIVLCVLFAGCASMPKFSGTANLCGLIVDENNMPVKNFLVRCYKNGVCIQNAMTNENGLYSFFDVYSGSYIIEGEKEGYTVLKKVKYDFTDRSGIVCACVQSTEQVLKDVNSALVYKDFPKANALLNELVVEDKSSEKLLILYYKAFIAIAQNDKKAFLSFQKKLRPFLKKAPEQIALRIEGLEKCFYDANGYGDTADDEDNFAQEAENEEEC